MGIFVDGPMKLSDYFDYIIDNQGKYQILRLFDGGKLFIEFYHYQNQFHNLNGRHYFDMEYDTFQKIIKKFDRELNVKR